MVTSRKGRVSRNVEKKKRKGVKKVTSRKGRVSRNVESLVREILSLV